MNAACTVAGPGLAHGHLYTDERAYYTTSVVEPRPLQTVDSAFGLLHCGHRRQKVRIWLHRMGASTAAATEASTEPSAEAAIVSQNTRRPCGPLHALSGRARDTVFRVQRTPRAEQGPPRLPRWHSSYLAGGPPFPCRLASWTGVSKITHKLNGGARRKEAIVHFYRFSDLTLL